MCLILSPNSKALKRGWLDDVRNKIKHPSRRIKSQHGKISQSVSGTDPILREACQLHDRDIALVAPLYTTKLILRIQRPTPKTNQAECTCREVHVQGTVAPLDGVISSLN